MKKSVLLCTLLGLLAISGFSQTVNYWSASSASRSNIVADKATTRQSFPKEVRLFTLNAAPLKQALFAAVNTLQSARRSAIISLPNAAGGMEEFTMFEASNFEPALQARFPEIRSFSGKGITDKAATLKLSISPQGIQTMVFRTGKANEFMEPYSQDHTVYAVFASQRETGSLPWTCTTPDENLATNLNQQIGNSGITARSGGDLKTMRLAQSVTAEYSNYFGATSAAQVSLVLAAINNTLTRCNGVYEKDLALHLNLVAASTSVIYYDPATDPYSPAAQKSNWNNQLQSALTANIGEANYDIGHLFGASGGGGNAGCIGCICLNGKGRGITSPADAIPQGDNFDIDYVAHEIGHQLGGNHTFSHSNEQTGVNKEVGSGITIMGYAGITGQDVAPHSIDIFHQATIAQIQANLAAKTCPVTTTISNATPVVAAVSNYTIPRSTPFALTGAATDANASDVLTYCWEQNDNAGTAQTNVNSVASPTKLTGPNWLTFPATTFPTRLFPRLSTILAGAQVTGPLPGGDAGANIEALSSVARMLNFRLTVRDNAPYRSTAPVSVGQTAFTDMVVTVSALSGPFVVTAPNTAVTWAGNSSQTITWDVAATTAAPVSCANVKISLSTDGGQTFPTVLAASTPNDGTEVLTIPNTPSNTARIKVEAVDNIFFDISNSNFTITGAQLPNLTINDITLNEGNNGTTSFTFTVNLSAPAPAGSVNFDIATANNTAIAPGDYTAGSLTAQTIPAGSSTYSFTVLVNGDVTVEPTELFYVNVTNATNVVITDGQGTGTITNDDTDPCATDATPPVITPKNNATVFLNANGQVTVQPSDVATVTDNCTVQSVTVSPNSFTCANITGATTYQPFIADDATGNQNAAGEQGMDFRVNAANGIVVTQLGAFDHQANGLVGTQPNGNGGFGIRVAIFNKANQSIVSGLDVVITGNGDAFSGNYRYKNIAAVTLPPGDYVVLAKGYNANELSGNSYLGGGPYPQGDNASGAISYLNRAYYDENDAVPGFTYPSVSVNTGTSSVLKSGTFTYALNQGNTVTVTATDASGNQSQITANVTVVDTMYVLTTKDITVNLNSSGQATIEPTDVLQSLKNKCGADVTSSTLQVSPSSFNCSNVGNATTYQPFIASDATGNQNALGEQGMDFRVNAADGIVITQLGAFDHQGNGIMGTGIRVAIFNKANQSIVSGLDVVITGNGDAFSGNYRYKNIAAVTLPPGDYVVLAKGYNANELSGNSYLGGGPYPQGDNASGAISFLNTVFYDENDAVAGFTYPNVSYNTGVSSVLKSGTFTYKTKMAAGTLVTLTATDVYGNQKQATATVTVTDFNQVCAPAAEPAPVMAAAISTKQPKEQIEVEKLSVYPNPSSGAFNVQLSGYSGPKVSMEIVDGNGKVVAAKAVTPGSATSNKTGMLTVPFDLGNKAAGMYQVRAVSATGVQTTKVLLQR